MGEIPLILLSLGKDGSRAYCGEKTTEAPAFLNENTIETTGAGDTFMGCMLHQILKKGYQNLSRQDMGRDACVCECSSINYYNQKRCSSSDARTSRK